MKQIAQIITLLLIFNACDKESNVEPTITNEFISAVDISRYPEIANSNPVFFDLKGNEKAFLDILKENGVNTIRLRLWVNPTNGHSGFDEVKQFSNIIKAKGFKTLITLHYSDTWADPANQEIPLQWQGIDIDALKDSVYAYTKKVIQELQPNYIQIGNEINSGLLHPLGHINSNYHNFIALMQMGIAAVRTYSNDTKIIIHFAGIGGSESFFNKVKTLDYDIIGLSYYPIWHGKSLLNLKSNIQILSKTYQKKVMIAETAYPFTLEWNDWTNNIIGLDEQLILPDYPATPIGQSKFIEQIRLLSGGQNGIGFCYWGGELIAWKGPQSKDGSPWENQALFNFTNQVMPVINEFKAE